MPIEEAGRLRKLANGRATRFLLNWFGIFFFLVYGNDHIQRSLQARQMATFAAAVLPREVAPGKEASHILKFCVSVLQARALSETVLPGPNSL